MRYLVNVIHRGPIDPAHAPPELYEAMGRFTAELADDGILIDAAGLEPVELATRVNLADGAIRVVDGPFAEAKEWIGGYFLLRCGSQAEAVDCARRSAELHRVHAPGMDLVHEVRRVADEA